MTRAALPSYERREQTYERSELAEAQTVADVDAMVYCPDCETSHPATRTTDGYTVDCPGERR